MRIGALAVICATTLLGVGEARADVDRRWGEWIDASDPTARPFEIRLAFDAMRLPVDDKSFDARSGRDYGFARPTVYSVGTEFGTFVRPHWYLGGLFAWGTGNQDTPSNGDTVAAALRSGRSISVLTFGVVNEGVVTFDRLTLRAGVVLGGRGEFLTIDRLNRQTPPQRGDLFFRPRVLAEVHLGGGFSLGAYGQTEGVDPAAWGIGGLLSWRINDIQSWGRL